MSGQLIEKLNSFNWKDDKPRMWTSCKFGVQVTACSMFLSFFIIICATVVYGERAMGLLIGLLAVHFFSAVITIGELGEISSIQRVFMKIEPETDIILKSEQLKNRCVLYACRVALVVIAVAVGFELQFVLFSGAVFALSGVIFTCIFSYKVRKLYPGDFVRIASFNLWGERKSSHEVNPATGLPMLNGSIDVGGNTWGSDDHHWDDRW